MKKYEIKQKIIELNIDMIRLQEVKMTKKVFSRFAYQFLPGTKFSYSDANGASSGIYMMQNP